MRRRDFIKIAVGSATAWPFSARGQQSGIPVIGFLNASSPEKYALPLSAFLKGLGETGFVDGRSVKIEFRWAEGRINRLPAMAIDLVRRQVAVIAACSTAAALAAPFRDVIRQLFCRLNVALGVHHACLPSCMQLECFSRTSRGQT
jgi:ABC-type uncharacterized transport system substrate-binding protein